MANGLSPGALSRKTTEFAVVDRSAIVVFGRPRNRLVGSVSVARRSGGIFVAVVGLLVAGPTPALAKAPPIYSDPQANSPAGTIYAIPLDAARQDAAPHGHAGSGAAGAGHARSAAGRVGGSGASGGGGSGSGDGVGGGTGVGDGATGTAPRSSSGSSTGRNRAATPATLIPGGQPGSLVHSSNGFGSSSAVPGLNAPAGAGYKAIAVSPSDAPVLAIVLSVVVILLGAFTGSRAWRVARAGS